jgi:hypothetical protein
MDEVLKVDKNSSEGLMMYEKPAPWSTVALVQWLMLLFVVEVSVTLIFISGGAPAPKFECKLFT